MALGQRKINAEKVLNQSTDVVISVLKQCLINAKIRLTLVWCSINANIR